MNRYTWNRALIEPSRNDGRHVFVFGSNLAGRHGKGAALSARRYWGAVYSVGSGPTGEAYAIPTKDSQLRALPLSAIREHVEDFLVYAAQHAELTFLITPIGCGLAGYTHEQIAPLFAKAPANCVLPIEWKPFIAPNEPIRVE